MSQPDLLTLSQTDVTHPIPPDLLATALSQPPFLSVPGTFNTRDLGLLPNSPIRPGLVYRSGGFLPPNHGGADRKEIKKVLVDKLRVKRVFDLRSVREHAQVGDEFFLGENEGVEVVWVQPGEVDERVKLEEFVEGEGETGYVKMYLGVLRDYKGVIGKVLEGVRDGRGEEALWFHCTAGRDRTGVVAALLLSLAGASAETIAFDFLLSRLGTEPARELLLGFAMKGSMAENMQAPGFHNLCNLRLSCWEAFVKALDEQHGGFEGYVTGTLGFSQEDLAKIKANLVVPN